MDTYYELTYLVSPEMSEDEIKDFSKKISGLISEKCKIAKPDLIKKTALYYPIKKKNGAYLITTEFYAEAKDAENLKKGLEKNTAILRFLMIKRINPEKIKTTKTRRIPDKIIKTQYESK